MQETSENNKENQRMQRITKHTNSWLVIMWTLSGIITISFNLYLKGHSCNIQQDNQIFPQVTGTITGWTVVQAMC